MEGRNDSNYIAYKRSVVKIQNKASGEILRILMESIVTAITRGLE